MRLNKNGIFLFVVLIFGIIFPHSCVSQNIEDVNKINSQSVYDYETILSTSEKKDLEEMISQFEANSQKEILIATTNSIGPMKDMQDYATYLRTVYIKDTNNNEVVVIAISKTLRKVWISTTDVSKQVVTDKLCDEIINNKMIPEFAKGKFYLGIKAGLEELTSVWK